MVIDAAVMLRAARVDAGPSGCKTATALWDSRAGLVTQKGVLTELLKREYFDSALVLEAARLTGAIDQFNSQIHYACKDQE